MEPVCGLGGGRCGRQSLRLLREEIWEALVAGRLEGEGQTPCFTLSLLFPCDFYVVLRSPVQYKFSTVKSTSTWYSVDVCM